MGSFQQVFLIGWSLDLPAIGPITGINFGYGGRGRNLGLPDLVFVYNHLLSHSALSGLSYKLWRLLRSRPLALFILPCCLFIFSKNPPRAWFLTASYKGCGHVCMRSRVQLFVTPWMPGSSVHGIFQARILRVGCISFRGSSQPRDQTQVACIFCIGRQILYHCASQDAHKETSKVGYNFRAWKFQPTFDVKKAVFIHMGQNSLGRIWVANGIIDC